MVLRLFSNLSSHVMTGLSVFTMLLKEKKIIDGKYLLDYDKKLPDPPEGILPQEISIEKHVVSFENGDKIYLVIYASKNLDLIKKYHRMPIFQEWGKPKDFWYQSIGG